MAADAPDQVLEEGADLGAGGRLARAQKDRHRLAAFHVIDVDEEEAAPVVMGVEERQLLVAVHGIAGVVDIEGDGGGRGGGAAKERQKRSTSAAVMRATSRREGAFSRRLMVGCEQSARPLCGARPPASLNSGSAQSVSQSSASS